MLDITKTFTTFLKNILMENKLDIFICANSDFSPYPKNNSYKIVSTENFDTKTGLEHIVCNTSKDNILLKEHAYSEFARYHYIYKNYNLKDYVGTAHYRRYFEFFGNIPDLDEIFKNHDAILPHPLNLDIFGVKSVYSQYEQQHNINDLDLVIQIIAQYYPEYFHSALKVISGDVFYPCNVFILKKDTFNAWCRFVFSILNIFDVMKRFRSDNDVINYVENNKELYWNKSTEYQSRIEAFLSERLSTIFMVQNIKNPYFENLILTESHYDFEKEMFLYNPNP